MLCNFCFKNDESLDGRVNLHTFRGGVSLIKQGDQVCNIDCTVTYVLYTVVFYSVRTMRVCQKRNDIRQII